MLKAGLQDPQHFADFEDCDRVICESEYKTDSLPELLRWLVSRGRISALKIDGEDILSLLCGTPSRHNGE